MKFFWPAITTMPEADKVARDGAGAAFFVGAGMALITFLQTRGMTDLFPYVNEYTYIDAALFIGIGCMILRLSRIAAVAGFVLFTVQQFFWAFYSGKHEMGILSLVIAISFLNSIRATFRYHALKKEYSRPKEEVTIAEALKPPPQAPARLRETRGVLLAAGGVLALALCTGAAVYFIKDRTAVPAAASSAVEVSPEDGSRVSFKLKDGRTVSGKVVYEDETYFTLQTMSGEEIVIKEDISR